ncbi:peptidyl-prolyl cis-trans isomerase SurA [Allopseudospirillum japonicum]|uniref:Chaperone SurA n=1 Tax=Allopseudospirillum japonicum TaxID=64971 RepID=A0A1H6T3Q2_9GAMM|nr:peptidylprolyl isomerase [Allopseudospirillum japonicum]SEI74723.1 peptidyl-prolyl cis-trans isomerase SurA [Allopseudospirillum japonicum]
MLIPQKRHLLAACLAGVLMTHPWSKVQAEVQPLDHLVAIVGEEAVMRSELDVRLARIYQQLQQKGIQAPPQSVLERQVLERLVVDTIQLQEAEKLNISIDEQTLNAALGRIAQQNGMDLLAFRDALQAQGIPYGQFREQIRAEMLIAQVRQRQVGERVNISEQAVTQYLQASQQDQGTQVKYQLAHILVMLPEQPTSEQVQAGKQKAQALRLQAQEGADFDTLAVAHSSGEYALSGGDLGWRTQAELPTLFAELVPSLQVGEVSAPIRSPSGFHLVKLVNQEGKNQAKHWVQQTHVRHILLKPNALRDEAASRALLLKLRERVLAGEDFAVLAREYSEDTGSKQAGGDLGWVNPGQLVPPFEQAMDTLKAGEVSFLVRTRFGWHLLEVLERRKADMTEELAQQEARQALYKREFEEEVDEWLREIRSRTYVEVRL